MDHNTKLQKCAQYGDAGANVVMRWSDRYHPCDAPGRPRTRTDLRFEVVFEGPELLLLLTEMLSSLLLPAAGPSLPPARPWQTMLRRSSAVLMVAQLVTVRALREDSRTVQHVIMAVAPVVGQRSRRGLSGLQLAILSRHG